MDTLVFLPFVYPFGLVVTSGHFSDKAFVRNGAVPNLPLNQEQGYGTPRRSKDFLQRTFLKYSFCAARRGPLKDRSLKERSLKIFFEEVLPF